VLPCSLPIYLNTQYECCTKRNMTRGVDVYRSACTRLKHNIIMFSYYRYKVVIGVNDYYVYYIVVLDTRSTQLYTYELRTTIILHAHRWAVHRKRMFTCRYYTYYCRYSSNLGGTYIIYSRCARYCMRNLSSCRRYPTRDKEYTHIIYIII